jgi:hypothetical protein
LDPSPIKKPLDFISKKLPTQHITIDVNPLMRRLPASTARALYHHSTALGATTAADRDMPKLKVECEINAKTTYTDRLKCPPG